MTMKIVMGKTRKEENSSIISVFKFQINFIF